MKRMLAVALALSMCTTVAGASQSVATLVADDPRLDLLVGYDSLSGEVKTGKCVALSGGSHNAPSPIPSTKSELKVDQSSSLQSLFERDELSVAASLGWGKFKGSATYNKLNSSAISSFTQVMTIRSDFEYDHELLDPTDIVWSDTGRRAMRDGNSERYAGTRLCKGKQEVAILP